MPSFFLQDGALVLLLPYELFVIAKTSLEQAYDSYGEQKLRNNSNGEQECSPQFSVIKNQLKTCMSLVGSWRILELTHGRFPLEKCRI